MSNTKKIKKFKFSGNWIWIVLLVLLGLSLFGSYFKNTAVVDGNLEIIKDDKEVSLTEFLELYHEGDFQKIILINDRKLQGLKFLSTGQTSGFMTLGKNLVTLSYNQYVTDKPENTSLKDLGISLTGTTIIVPKYEEEGFLMKTLGDILPLVIGVLIFFLIMKFLLPRGGGMSPFNISAGKQADPKLVNTNFTDIAGLDEVKGELSEIVDYLKNTQRYAKVGARHPKGVLLYGQPGSGKTLLARAVAGEANVPFFSVSGSEFMEMLVGMGAAKVRALFKKAKDAGKAIIFIDEIDAIGRKRGTGHTGGHQEQEQTLNQILTEMDGFDNQTQVIVIAATNRLDILDPALMRAGRFDRKIMVATPTLEERIAILKYYLKKKKIDDNVDLESLAKRTSGLVGADLENIVNEASLRIAKNDKTVLTNEDFEYALEKVLMGPEKRVKTMKEHEKKIITYHELGHAVTSYMLPNADPVEKISIVRRGYALGATWKIPEEDQYLYSKSKILEETISLLGGRAAEEVFFGKEEITTGASNDFEKATGMIRRMITTYGMDEDLGNICYDLKDDDYSVYKPYSEHTAEHIDKKVKSYMADCYQQSKKILIDNKKKIEKMADVLLEKEYLSKKEFNDLMKEE